MKTVAILIILFSTAYAQDYDGENCPSKPNFFERLAQDVDQVITTMARNSWNSVIQLKEEDWPFASTLLRYSLQDNPEDLYFSTNSRAAELVRDSSAYQTALQSINDELAQSGENGAEGELLIQFKSGDLYVALHNVRLKYKAHLEDGEWKIVVNIHDTYDFAHHTREEVESFKIRAINNMAYSDQERGVITPYDITFEMEETFSIKSSL